MTPEAILILIFCAPLVGALGIAASGRYPNQREAITMVTAIILMGAVWSLLPAALDGEYPELTLFEVFPGVPIAFKMEPLGLLFACLASLLWIVNSVYSIGYMRGNNEKHQTRFYALFAISLWATMGIAMASNLLTLFLFYEVLTICTYPLVTHKGDENARKSGRVYLGILMGASIFLLLPAIVWTYAVTGTLEFQQGGILEGNLSGPAIGVMLALYVFGIGKAAVMPFHRWLPAAMVAPTPVSALLHAVAVVKAGVFSVAKIIIYVFGVDFLFPQSSAAWLVPIAAFTVVVGSLMALQQTNLKRMLAYSTISQLSYIVMATAVLTPLSEIGAALHMVAHGFGKITLFFAAGAIYTASKKTELDQLRGIGRRMPWTMTAFAVGAFSMIGVPPTAGFVSKWYILAGAFESDNLIVVFTIIASTALNAAYFLPIVFRAFFREENVPPKKEHGEANLPIVLALMTTTVLTLALFVFNQPFVDLETQLVEVVIE